MYELPTKGAPLWDGLKFTFLVAAGTIPLHLHNLQHVYLLGLQQLTVSSPRTVLSLIELLAAGTLVIVSNQSASRHF
jgi:hypothetical protein